MGTTTTLESILGTAQEDQANRFALYRVAADHAEDTGRPCLASGLRWVADYRRQPRVKDRPSGPRWVLVASYGESEDSAWQDNDNQFPYHIGQHLAGGYGTFAEAILDAARAVAIEQHGMCEETRVLRACDAVMEVMGVMRDFRRIDRYLIRNGDDGYYTATCNIHLRAGRGTETLPAVTIPFAGCDVSGEDAEEAAEELIRQLDSRIEERE